MATAYTGGCARGAIRYECGDEPMFMWVCHCRECQRATGAGGAVNVVFARPAVRFTKGEPKYHVSTGTSGEKTRRGFCTEFGSPLAARADLIPDIHGVSAARMDDPAKLQMTAEIWTSSAQPWDTMSPKLPKFETTPTPEDIQQLVSH